MNDLNNVLKLVCLDQGASNLSCSTCLACVHFFGSSLRSKEGEDATATADIHDDLVAEVRGIPNDGVAVAGRPYRVLQHVLLVLQLRVVVEILLYCRFIVCVDTTSRDLFHLSGWNLCSGLWHLGCRPCLLCLLGGELSCDASDLLDRVA